MKYTLQLSPGLHWRLNTASAGAGGMKYVEFIHIISSEQTQSNRVYNFHISLLFSLRPMEHPISIFFIYFFENVSGSVWLSLFINSWAYYEVRQYIEFSSPFCPKEWSLSINSDFFKILTFIERQKYALYIIDSVMQLKSDEILSRKKKRIIKIKSKNLMHNTEVHIECLLYFN
jgi:hypothetical protein